MTKGRQSNNIRSRDKSRQDRRTEKSPRALPARFAGRSLWSVQTTFQSIKAHAITCFCQSSTSIACWLLTTVGGTQESTNSNETRLDAKTGSKSKVRRHEHALASSSGPTSYNSARIQRCEANIGYGGVDGGLMVPMMPTTSRTSAASPSSPGRPASKPSSTCERRSRFL